MALRSFFGNGRHWPLPLAVTAAARLSVLPAGGKPLAALGAAGALCLLWMAGVPAPTAFASLLNFLRGTTTTHGHINIATAGDAIPSSTGKPTQRLNLCQTALDRADFAWIGS